MVKAHKAPDMTTIEQKEKKTDQSQFGSLR
jgi:hypothetical protein